VSAQVSKVLVADDDSTVRLLMAAALEPHGFEVHAFENGQAAWNALQSEPFDIVLLDIDMPKLDGFTLCRMIRTDLKSDVPVLLVTGHDDVESIESAYEVGATDFIAKPINWALLSHRLRYVLRGSRTQQSLESARARHRATLRALPDLLIRVNNEGALVERHGLQDGGDAPQAESLETLLPDDAAAICLSGVQAAIKTGNVQDVEYSIELNGQKLRIFEGRIAAVNQDEAICVLRDVTERREADQRIVSLAYFDPLTGLPNRQSFQEYLKLALHRSEREKAQLAVLFMDIDGFKAVNDSLGHVAGDTVLKRVSERLRTCLRMSDSLSRHVPGVPDPEPSVSRLGGDEFTVLLPVIANTSDAMVVAHRIREAFVKPFMIDGHALVLSTSIGIAVYPEDAADSETLIKHADTAMYAAKANGRDQCQFYSASLTEFAVHKLKMESALRLALERNELRVHYQPIIDMATDRVTNVEALVRWQHPELGLLTPQDFIGIAEECGLIGKLGAQVLAIACRDAVLWNRSLAHPVSVSVNLSVLQLTDPELPALVRATLDAAGLPAKLLELEITESALIEQSELTLKTLNAFREMGVHIALDDFGTGYSSLAYLRELPLSVLKIDRTFVEDLPHSAADTAIVRTIIALSDNLGLRVVGEGVERTTQADTLRLLGCASLQGFLFSKPIAFEKICEYLTVAQKQSKSA
jgi:diguanylate cyclase (GGDEF)-like protein